MSDWQERITRETAPAIRVEHDLRYRIAAPLIASSGAWADLGCGNGIAATAALGAQRPGRAILVDVEPEAVARAAAELQMAAVETLAGDLTDPDVLGEIGERLTAAQAPRAATCFEVVEHLSSFVPLLEWSVQLAAERDVTFLLSVPNDAFWSIENPHHRTCWGPQAFDELRRLLPEEQTLLRQIAVVGSGVAPWEGDAGYEMAVELGGEQAIPTHFIAAFGPRHRELALGALAVQSDLTEQREWERQRESDLVSFEQMLGECRERVAMQEAVLTEQREQINEHIAQFDAWRAYIHELEGELGRPLSGTSSDEPTAA